MSSTLYLIIMLTIIAVLTAAVAPAMLTARCPHCRRRNSLDAVDCAACGGTMSPKQPDKRKAQHED